jgi:hypothetical protein
MSPRIGILPPNWHFARLHRVARETNMSAPLYGTRPPMADPGDPTQTPGIGVSTRLVRLDPGLFSLELMPNPADRRTGLPGVRVSQPPAPPGRREAVTISTMRGDGWMTVNDEPTLLRVPAGGAEVLVTLYWSTAEAGAVAPPLKLTRLNPEPAAAGPAAPLPAPAVPHGPFPTARAAEIVAHIEGVGDVDGKIGDWVGMRGSGRAIEGFSLTPTRGLAVEEFDIRAVLGRDWLSPWLPGGSFCGSRGLALPLRGFCLRLRPTAAARLDLACFARFVDGSEVGPVGSEQLCAATTLTPLEAFQVLLRPRTP